MLLEEGPFVELDKVVLYSRERSVSVGICGQQEMEIPKR